MDKEQTSSGPVAIATDKCKRDQTVVNDAGRPTDHVTTDSSANGRPVLVSTPERPPGSDCAHALRRMSSFVPPDGGWGWAVVAGSFIAFFLSGGLSRSFTLIYQHMLEEFGQSAAATSATAALFGAVKMCTSEYFIVSFSRTHCSRLIVWLTVRLIHYESAQLGLRPMTCDPWLILRPTD